MVCQNPSFIISLFNYILNPLSAGGEHSMLPLCGISSCALDIDFWVAPNGWQFLSIYIFEGSFPSQAKNYLGKVSKLSFWARGHFWVSKNECNLYFWSYNGMWLVKIGVLEMVNASSPLPGVCHMQFTCMQKSVWTPLQHKDMRRHIKCTLEPTGNGLILLGIPKNPHWDQSHVSVASFCLISGGGIRCSPPAELYKIGSLQTKG